MNLPELVGPEGLAPGAIIIDGHDDAILGISGRRILIYERAAILKRLMKRDGMSRRGADEFIEYNIETGNNGFGFILVERI